MSPINQPPSVPPSQQGMYAHHPHTPHASHPAQQGWPNGHPSDGQSVLSPAGSGYMESPQPTEEQMAMTPAQQVFIIIPIFVHTAINSVDSSYV